MLVYFKFTVFITMLFFSQTGFQVCVSECVFVCVRVCVCVSLWMCVCVSLRVCVCLNGCIHVHTSVRARVYISADLCLICV